MVKLDVAHPEDPCKICIIHDVDHIFSHAGLLFGDIKQELLCIEDEDLLHE